MFATLVVVSSGSIGLFIVIDLLYWLLRIGLFLLYFLFHLALFSSIFSSYSPLPCALVHWLSFSIPWHSFLLLSVAFLRLLLSLIAWFIPHCVLEIPRLPTPLGFPALHAFASTRILVFVPPSLFSFYWYFTDSRFIDIFDWLIDSTYLTFISSLTSFSLYSLIPWSLSSASFIVTYSLCAFPSFDSAFMVYSFRFYSHFWYAYSYLCWLFFFDSCFICAYLPFIYSLLSFYCITPRLWCFMLPIATFHFNSF